MRGGVANSFPKNQALPKTQIPLPPARPSQNPNPSNLSLTPTPLPNSSLSLSPDTLFSDQIIQAALPNPSFLRSENSSAIDLSSSDRTATPGFLSDRKVPNFGGSAISNVVSSGGDGGVAAVSSAPRASHEADSNGSSSIVSCHKCGEQFGKWEAAEAHHLYKHAASQIPKHMQHLLKPIYCTMSGASKEPLGTRDMVKEKGFRVTTDPGILSSILKWASDAEVRKQSYISGNSVPRANLDVLDKLIAARHELAEIMGYKSYAQFTVHPNIASSPKVVMPFLLDLSKIVRHKADEEF